jgi:hypothetical protein
VGTAALTSRRDCGVVLVDDAQLFGKFLRVEWRAVENATVEFKGGNFVPASVGAPYKICRVGIFLDIDFFKRDLPNLKELFGAATVGAKARRIHAECGVHFLIFEFLESNRGKG